MAPKTATLPSAEEIGNLVPISRIAKDTPYSPDFLRQLARSGKIRAYKLHRDWLTTPDAIRVYLKSQAKRHEKALGLLQAAEKAFLVLSLLLIVFSAAPKARAQALQNPPPQQESTMLALLHKFTSSFFGKPNGGATTVQPRGPEAADIATSAIPNGLGDSTPKQSASGPTTAQLTTKKYSMSAALHALIASWHDFGTFYVQQFSAVGTQFNSAVLALGQAFLGKTSEEYLADVPGQIFATHVTSSKVLGIQTSTPSEANSAASDSATAPILASTAGAPNQSVAPVVSKSVSAKRGIGIPTTASGSKPEVLSATSDLESQIQDLINSTFQRMLAQALLTGPKGDKGDSALTPGFSGPNGIVQNDNGKTTAVIGGTPIVSYLPSIPANNFTGTSLAGFGQLSASSLTAQSATIQNALTVQGSATISGSESVAGSFTAATSTISNLTVSGSATAQSLNVTGPATFSGSTTIAGLTVTGLNPGLTPGSVAFQGAAGLSQDNANFFYDSTNHRLGLGTTTPVQTLTVIGNATISGNSTTSGNQIISGTLNVSGVSTLATTTITNLTASSPATLQSSLSVTATSTLAAVTATTLTTTGSVGVGQTSPVQKVDIFGTRGNPATSGSASDGLLRLSDTAGDNNALDFGVTNIPAQYAGWIQVRNLTNYATNYNLLLQPNGGSVGIGSTSPVATLGVTGTANITGAVTLLTALGYGSGGTNQTSYNTNGVLYAGASALQSTAAGTSFQILRSNGNAAPTYSDISSLLIAGSNITLTGTSTIAVSSSPTFATSVTSPIYTASGALAIKPGADSTAAIQLQTSGGTSVLNVDTTNQRIGIGTTTPGVALDVNGTTKTSNAFISGAASGNDSFRLAPGGASKWALYTVGNDMRLFDYATGNTDRVTFQTGGSVGIGTTNPLQKFVVSNAGAEGFEVSPAGGNVIIQAYNRSTFAYAPLVESGSNLNFQISGNSKMYVDTNGNVGIGNVAPAYLLDVNAASGVGTDLFRVASSTGSTGIVVKNNGNVGIGNTNPGALLQVGASGGSSGTGIRINMASGQNHLIFANAGSDKWLQYTTGNDMRFYDVMNAADKVTFQAGGNVGIGTTNPTLPLHAIGQAANLPATSGSTQTGGVARFQGGSNNVILDIGSDGIGGAWLQATHIADLSLKYPLLLNPNGGNVGIGTTTATLGPLTMASGAYVSSGGTWTNASDRSLKENFATMTPADILQKIDQLSVTQWDYKSEGAGVNHIGPVAQDFWAAFHLGNSQTSISTIDPAGVALLGIQALDQKIALLQGALSGNTTTTNGAPLSVTSPSNFSGDSVGEAKILTGQNSVRVSFTQPYTSQPIVTITLEGTPTPLFASVIDRKSNGFTIQTLTNVTSDTTFSWHSFASPAASLTVSDGSTAPIILILPPASAPATGPVLPGPDLTTAITTISSTPNSTASSTSSAVLGTSTTTPPVAPSPAPKPSPAPAPTPNPEPVMPAPTPSPVTSQSSSPAPTSTHPASSETSSPAADAQSATLSPSPAPSVGQ